MGMGMQLLQIPRGGSQPPHASVEWIERVVAKHWQAMSDLVGPTLMPLCDRAPALEHMHCTQYGCGRYGCVMPTASPDVVFKVTSDPSEAAFVAAYIEAGDPHLGIVRYDWIVELPEKYEKRRTFAIWRQPANNIGFVDQAYLREEEATERYYARFGTDAIPTLAMHTSAFMDDAAWIRELVKKSRSPEKLIDQVAAKRAWALDLHETMAARYPRVPHSVLLYQADETEWSAAKRIAWWALRAGHTADEMRMTEAGLLIGGALRFYLSRGMLLADVHRNNIGEVVPKGYSDWELVITDPGHMVPLDRKWLDVKVPQLYP